MRCKKVLSPDVASEEYLKLEEEYKELGVYIKKVSSKTQKAMLRNKRKAIRERQNYLYTQISGSGYLQDIAKELGINYHSLYRRTLKTKK